MVRRLVPHRGRQSPVTSLKWIKQHQKIIMKLAVLINIILFFSIESILIERCAARAYHPNEAAYVSNFSKCVTPNREGGLCIFLENCKNSQCGYVNGKVLICCPYRYHNSPVSNNNKLLPEPGQCGNVISNRIYGGNITKIDEYPWMALLEYTKPSGAKGHHCGGSLINSRYIVTAAHCVNGKGIPFDWKLTGVRLGEWNTATNPDCEVNVLGQKDCAPEHIDVAVERSLPHPAYDPSSKNQANDIALLRLNRNIPYTDFVSPICLPYNAKLHSTSFDGVVMDVSGWGKTETGSKSTLKLKAAVNGIKLDECRNIYSRQGIFLEDGQMCAGGQEGIDSCRGDSGGPLISLNNTNNVSSYYFLVGVVSFGPTPCGSDGWPGVYTRLGKYIDWIQYTIEK